MTTLSVNVNKIATLRNARGANLPDVLKTTLDIERFGAQGITVHPRPDERHIKFQDVVDIKNSISVELNVEGYPSADFIELIHRVKPAQVTLVPDPPDVITSNAGWDVEKHADFLKEKIAKIKDTGARVSLFIDPADYVGSGFEQLVDVGTDRIELYTEAYAKAFATPRQEDSLKLYVNAARKAERAGLKVNAGHDLNVPNLRTLKTAIPTLSEVSIGHALICDALYLGLKDTIRLYLDALK